MHLRIKLATDLEIAAVLVALLCPCSGAAQSLAEVADLPDSPGALMQSAPLGPSIAPTPQAEEAPGESRVDGIVKDVQDDPVPQATVVLTAPGKLGERTITAGSDGSFSFTHLVPAEYRLIITAPGFTTYTSAPFAVKAGETLDAPKIALVISTSTSVNVVASPDQVAVAEIHEQEKQRVLGVFQNFYTSYIWDAQPMPVSQKYKLAFRALLDPFQFLIVAAAAGALQINGTYPGYGPGIEGYGKRYGAALADSATSRIVGSAILPSVLHQDPRYFYQGSGGFRSRALHAIISTVVCRGDNGKLQPNYSHILGSLAAGGLANTYHPESSRGVGLTFETLGITTGGNVAGNLFREFVLRGLVPSVPDYANGKR